MQSGTICTFSFPVKSLSLYCLLIMLHQVRQCSCITRARSNRIVRNFILIKGKRFLKLDGDSPFQILADIYFYYTSLIILTCNTFINLFDCFSDGFSIMILVWYDIYLNNILLYEKVVLKIIPLREDNAIYQRLSS